MKQLFWLFVIALTAFKKDSHATLGKNLLKSEAAAEEVDPFLSFLKSSNPDASETEKINQLFQDLLPPAKRKIFFKCFDAFIENKENNLDKKTFEIFFKENYLKLDKELSESLLIDLTNKDNYFNFKQITMSDQEIISLFHRTQDLTAGKDEKNTFRIRILKRILPLTFEEEIHHFFCQQYDLISADRQNQTLLEAAKYEYMWDFSKNQFSKLNQKPKDKLQLLQVISSRHILNNEISPQEKINKTNEYTSFIVDRFDSVFAEYEKDESVEEASKKSQFLRNVKADIIQNLLCKKGPDHGLKYCENLKKLIANEFNILSLSEKISVIYDLFKDPNDELPLKLLVSIKENGPEVYAGLWGELCLQSILEKAPIESPQSKELIQWFAERFEHFNDKLAAKAAERIITPENARSFTEKVVKKVPLQNNHEIISMGFGFFGKRYNKNNILDFAIENFSRNNFDLETTFPENSHLQMRNENLNIFIKDLLKILNSKNYDGYHNESYKHAINNHKKLKNSILCMKELLGDQETGLLLKNYNFNGFNDKDRHLFCNIADQVGHINTFIDSSYVLETSIPGLRDGTFNAICLNVANAKTANNPTGFINLEDQEWKLRYAYKSNGQSQVVFVEFSPEEREVIRKFNQKSLPTKDECIKNLNNLMERFETFEKETLPNTKKSAKESDEKNAPTCHKTPDED
jgi:hypothetical protein